MKISKLMSWWFPEKKPSFYKNLIFIESFGDIPTDTGVNIYIVGTKKSRKWVALKCPCMLHRIEINLMATKYPRWRIKIKHGKLTLWPSIIVSGHSCHSHFWIKDSNIEWAFDTD